MVMPVVNEVPITHNHWDYTLSTWENRAVSDALATGTAVMTAKGWRTSAQVEAYVKAEAARIGKQTPLEVEHA